MGETRALTAYPGLWKLPFSVVPLVVLPQEAVIPSRSKGNLEEVALEWGTGQTFGAITRPCFLLEFSLLLGLSRCDKLSFQISQGILTMPPMPL